MDDDEERQIFLNKLAGKTYISGQVPYSPGRVFRFASKVFDSADIYEFAEELGEVVIRVTPAGRQQITAKFTEDDRGIFRLTFQRWTTTFGRPVQQSFSFSDKEVAALLEFLVNIKTMNFPNADKVNVKDDELRILLSKGQARQVILDNPELVASIVQNEITTSDVVALGYRRRQLERFGQLLQNDEASEKDWQQFFEENHWVFGYGLSYVSFAGLDDAKLEQIVAGATVADFGKRTDALMKTQAVISSLCFVEIKKHTTELLKPGPPYRSGTWQVSSEVVGGIAQTQATVQSAMRSLGAKFAFKNEMGDPTGEEVLNVEPRSFLVVGRLSEFQTDEGVNEDKHRSFEMFRRHLNRPEIVTFDELYYRAQFIVGTEPRGID